MRIKQDRTHTGHSPEPAPAPRVLTLDLARERGPRIRSTVLPTSFIGRSVPLAAFAALLLSVPAAAQESAPQRTRIALGPQFYPSYPGSDDFDLGPLIDYERKPVGEQFEFEAPDESFDLALVDRNGFSFGPALNWEGARSAEDVGADLPKVKFSIEPGAFVSYQVSDGFRLRAEMRKGVTGHKGMIGMAGADFVMRDGDDWLFSAGPRVTWSDDTYQDAWFGVAPEDAAPSGLAAYDPGGGVQAYGATASFLKALSPRWGIQTYAKYDRLVGDAADSPIVRQHGSRDQFSGGLALAYTFGSTGQ